MTPDPINDDQILSPYEEEASEDALFDEEPNVIRFTHTDGRTVDYVHIDVINALKMAIARDNNADINLIFESLEKRQQALAGQ